MRYGCRIVPALVCALTASLAAADEPVLPEHAHAALPVEATASLALAVDTSFERYPPALELAARAGEAEAWQARGGSLVSGRPLLTFRYQTDRWGPDYGLTEYEAGLVLPLWNPGGRSAVRSVGAAYSEEALAADAAYRWQLGGLMRDALWQIALAENDLESARHREATASRLAGTIRRRYELGDVAEADLLLARAAWLDAQEVVIEAEAGMLDAERTWRSIAGLDWRPPFAAEALAEADDIGPAHPAMALADAGVRRAEAAVTVADRTAAGNPTLTIGPRSERPANSTVYDDSIGITFSVPFGGSSHRRTEVSTALRQAAAARAARAQLMKDLSLGLHEAAHSLNVVAENLDAATERRDLAVRHLAMAESAYEKGEIDLVDLLKSQTTEIDASRQVSRLVIERSRQTARYNQAAGVQP